MKIIILLAGYGKRMRPHTWSRPKPLLRVAGNAVVGHLLDLMAAITKEEVFFVVGYKGEQIEAWVRKNYPQLDSHFVLQEKPMGQAHAVWLCRDYLDENETVVAFGDGIVEADYEKMAERDVDGVLLVKEVEDPRRYGVAVLDKSGFVVDLIEKPPTTEHKLALAGINWFRSGNDLFKAVDTVIQDDRRTLGEFFMVDAYKVMLETGARLRTMPIRQWADAGTPRAILDTNARLLSIGYGTADALERSYADGFSLNPPVYLDPTAEIESAVIGPYASIGAGVKITNAVVRNSIIDPGVVIKDCILDGALIGENARVIGRPKGLFVGDNSKVDLG